MKKTMVVLVALFLAGGVSAVETCDLGDTTVCNQQGWGEDPDVGNYGDRTMGDLDVIVQPGDCTDSSWWATVDFSGGTLKLVPTGDEWPSCDTYGQGAVSEIRKDGNEVQIDHLDGLADDSLDVYWNNELICSYGDQYDVETWLTTTCYTETMPTPEFSSLTLALLGLIAAPGLAYLYSRR